MLGYIPICDPGSRSSRPAEVTAEPGCEPLVVRPELRRQIGTEEVVHRRITWVACVQPAQRVAQPLDRSRRTRDLLAFGREKASV
jgi:hypothetical protein